MGKWYFTRFGFKMSFGLIILYCTALGLHFYKVECRYNTVQYVMYNITMTEAEYKLEILLNKANLRDLIAATGLVILLKFDPNHRFFVPCDLEI